MKLKGWHGKFSHRIKKYNVLFFKKMIEMIKLLNSHTYKFEIKLKIKIKIKPLKKSKMSLDSRQLVQSFC